MGPFPSRRRRSKRTRVMDADGLLEMFHCPYEGCSQVYVALSSFQVRPPPKQAEQGLLPFPAACVLVSVAHRGLDLAPSGATGLPPTCSPLSFSLTLPRPQGTRSHLAASPSCSPLLCRAFSANLNSATFLAPDASSPGSAQDAPPAGSPP